MRSRWLWIILVVALTLRVALLAAVWDKPWQLVMPDSMEYLGLARHLADDGEFARDYPKKCLSLTPHLIDNGGPPPGRYPELYRTPGYPLMLAAARQAGKACAARWPVGPLFKESEDTSSMSAWSHQVRIATVVQILLDVLLVYFAFLLGRRFAGQTAGLMAAAFQAVAPVAVVSSVRILSDTPFAILLIGAVLLLIRHFDTGRWWPLLLAAVLAGAACYVRPVGLAFVVIAVGVLLVRQRRVGRAAAFVGIAVALVGPWVVRNGVAASYWGFSSFASDSIYYYSAPKTLAAAEKASLDAAHERLDAELHDRPIRAGVRLAPSQDHSPALVQCRAAMARQTLLAHPLIYARIHLVGCTAFWMPAVYGVAEIMDISTGQRGTLEVLHTRGPLAAARHYLGSNWRLVAMLIPAGLLLAFKYAMAAVCAVRRVRWRMSGAGWLILLTVLAFALVGGPGAIPRYRVPVEPLLSAAAAAGLIWSDRALKRRRAAKAS